MKVLVIAQAAHLINIAYAMSLGETNLPSWDAAPEQVRASTIAGVEMHLANPDTTPELSHQSWLAAKEADGWKYGEQRDYENKLHPCILPYEDLPPEQKAKDYLFQGVVHALKDIPDGEAESETIASLQGQVAQLSEQLTNAKRVATPAEASAPDTSNRTVTNGQAVKYIGFRPEWEDRVYNSGIAFVTDQVRVLPFELARSLLRHTDLFEPATVETETETASTEAPITDDTQALLDKGKKATDEKDSKQFEVQALYDQIDRMNSKAAVAHFAKVNYNQELDTSAKLVDLKANAKRFIDQFGVV